MPFRRSIRLAGLIFIPVRRVMQDYQKFNTSFRLSCIAEVYGFESRHRNWA